MTIQITGGSGFTGLAVNRRMAAIIWDHMQSSYRIGAGLSEGDPAELATQRE